MLKDLIERMAKALVDESDQVQVSEITNDNRLVFEFKVAQEDIGQAIRKKGRVANSMRTILTAAAANAKKHVTLEIAD